MSFGDVTGPPTKEKEFCKDLDSTEAFVWANEHGLEVVFPKPNELFLDIDDEESFQVFERNKNLVAKFIGITNEKITPSRSGNRHIIVSLDREVTPMERLLLQAILGSDRRCVGHCLRKLREGDPTPVLFFEKKPIAKRMGEFLGV